MNIRTSKFFKSLPLLILGILSWLGFSYLFTLYSKIVESGSIYKFQWHYDAPIWAFWFSLGGALLTISIRWKFSLLTDRSEYILRDFIILICLIPINSLIINFLLLYILNGSYTGRGKSGDFDWVVGFLHNFITQTFVSMTCIGYFYLTLVKKTKEKLLHAQQARAAMELKTLQQNIEPHFLFNNLNVLSALIETNPTKANEFLSRLSELYRYVSQTQTLETVSVKDEIEFAKNYAYLLQERFGKAYNFCWEISENHLNGQEIIPVALQSLIENAVKHNAGNAENPLQILIKSEKDSLSAENEIRPKKLTFPSGRSGLQNLKNRYALLTDTPVEIFQNEYFFKVKLPLIKKTETPVQAHNSEFEKDYFSRQMPQSEVRN